MIVITDKTPTQADLEEASAYFATVRAQELGLTHRQTTERTALRFSLLNALTFVVGFAAACMALGK